MPDFLAAAGPIWGPDFVTVTVTKDGLEYDVEVFPDANNPELRDAGLPTQYYWQPKAINVARRQDDPADFDFGMTVFKGLMTSDRDVAVTSADQEAGGGWLTFSTTFGLPDGVVAQALDAIQRAHHTPPAARIAHYFNYQTGDPTPNLGPVTISENTVTINVADLTKATPGTFIEAVGAKKGSIEASGVSSFLVTCNQLAAGAIAGGLKAGGAPPFTIECDLKEQFWMDACNVEITCDVDKVYDSVSAAVSAGGFLGLCSASLNAAYSNMQTNGAITTKITMDSGMLTADQQAWIMKFVGDAQQKIWDMVKSEIFDWDPSKTDTPASAPLDPLASLFGGAAVAVKADYQRRGIHLTDALTLQGPISVMHGVMGTLEDVMVAVRANLGKYLAIIDIGQFFEKVQVAATCMVHFADELLPDGTNLRDPIQSAQLVASYPDFNRPLNDDGTPNLIAASQGFHYTIGQTQSPPSAAQPFIWTKDDAKDTIGAGFLRLVDDVHGWPAGQVRLTQTLVYDGDDPRVDLASDKLIWTSTTDTSTELAPQLTQAAVGYVHVHFMLDRGLPADNVTLTLTLTLGSRTDTVTITRATQNDIVWEIFSDKYLQEKSFTYSIQVEVTGPNFTDDPVIYQHDTPVPVAVEPGRIKYLKGCKVLLPHCPDDKVETVNRYIKAALAPAPVQA